MDLFLNPKTMNSLPLLPNRPSVGRKRRFEKSFRVFRKSSNVILLRPRKVPALLCKTGLTQKFTFFFGLKRSRIFVQCTLSQNLTTVNRFLNNLHLALS